MKIFNLNGHVITGTCILLAIYLLTAAPTLADYSITWYTIDGGGGQSIGGSYVLTGTIGQPDAAYSAGGGYELLGGFWPGGPLCFVDFESFARLAEYWADESCDEGNNFCDGADFEPDGDVDLVDLGLFVDEWLCYCPAGWPLE